MTAKTGSQPSQPQHQSDSLRDHTDLDRRYGAIGIMSVAAAMRYTSPGKHLAATPALPVDLRFVESTN